jgi:hypothetical protein
MLVFEVWDIKFLGDATLSTHYHDVLLRALELFVSCKLWSCKDWISLSGIRNWQQLCLS